MIVAIYSSESLKTAPPLIPPELPTPPLSAKYFTMSCLPSFSVCAVYGTLLSPRGFMEDEQEPSPNRSRVLRDTLSKA